MPPHMLQIISMTRFKPHRSNFLKQLLRWLKISCIGQKVNCGQHIVKLHDFWSTSSFWSYIHHLIEGWSWFIKKTQDLHKSQTFQIRVSQWKVNQTLTEHNFFILSQKFFHHLLFWRKFNSLQLHVSKACPKNASFWWYGSKHYRSFSKSTKSWAFLDNCTKRDICQNPIFFQMGL